jgi:hypothetical protein
MCTTLVRDASPICPLMLSLFGEGEGEGVARLAGSRIREFLGGQGINLGERSLGGHEDAALHGRRAKGPPSLMPRGLIGRPQQAGGVGIRASN